MSGEPLVPGGGIQRIAEDLLNRLNAHVIETRLHADECLLRPPWSRQARCIRGDHPTPTSDCTTQDWIKHITEEPK